VFRSDPELACADAVMSMDLSGCVSELEGRGRFSRSG